jgi:hypothetical protein
VSKLNKLITSPKKFFDDALAKSAVRRIRNMGADDRDRLGLPHARTQGIISKAAPPKNDNRNDLALAQKLLRFERTFPVNSLVGGDAAPGLLLWPFFRHLFWVRCQTSYKGKNAATVNTSKFYVSSDWQAHYKRQISPKTLDEMPEEHHDFLFFTNIRGTEQTRFEGKIYNRITDPVFEVAQTLGAAKKVEVIKSTGEIWPHRMHDVDLILPPMLRKVGNAPLTGRPSNFVDHVNKVIPEAKFDEKSYNDCLEWFFHQRDFYTEVLRKYNPKVVFFVGFDYHLALICAAKSLGIKTVDLQHGVQSGWSPVYSHWQAVPHDGYSMLPDVFWVWGDYDARKIRDTFGSEPDICGIKALVGGFPWLDRQQILMDEDVPEKLQKLAMNIPTQQNSEAPTDQVNKKLGLLTLQDQTVFPKLFAEIIKKTSDKMDWIVKRHPKHRNINLSSVKQNALYGTAIDDVSFLTLIRATDIHLTECSTAVIEADYLGVPSVVTGEQGLLNYQDFINDGTVYHVDNADDFNERLDDFLTSGGESRMNVVDNSNVERTLRTLLGQL